MFERIDAPMIVRCYLPVLLLLLFRTCSAGPRAISLILLALFFHFCSCPPLIYVTIDGVCSGHGLGIYGRDHFMKVLRPAHRHHMQRTKTCKHRRSRGSPVQLWLWFCTKECAHGIVVCIAHTKAAPCRVAEHEKCSPEPRNAFAQWTPFSPEVRQTKRGSLPVARRARTTHWWHGKRENPLASAA